MEDAIKREKKRGAGSEIGELQQYGTGAEGRKRKSLSALGLERREENVFMSAAPKVSVIVPVYNTEAYLCCCVNSILNQSMGEIEVILIDDGSTDQCPQICDQFAQRDGRVNVVHQRNRGVSAARNQGIRAAAADWIMFVDSDDWIEADAVKILYEKACSGQYDMVCAPLSNSLAKENLEDGIAGEYFTALQAEFLLRRILHFNEGEIDLGYSWGKIYKKSVMVAYNCFFPDGLKLWEDQIFNLSVLQHMDKVFILNTEIYHYRMRDDSAVHSIHADQSSIYQTYHSELYSIMKEHQLFEGFEQYYYFQVSKGILALSTIYSLNVRGLGGFCEAVQHLKKFAEEPSHAGAIDAIRMDFIPKRAAKVGVWLLKRHLYRVIMLIRCVQNKLKKRAEKLHAD